MNDDSPRRTGSSEDAVVAIVLAAGMSSRMDGLDKLWAELDGMPVFAYAVRAMAWTAGVTEIIVVAPRSRHTAIGLTMSGSPVPIRCVEGGARRQDSVAAAIAAAPDAAWYLVQDGARPLVTPQLGALVLAAARRHGAAAPGVAVADTIKRVGRGVGIEPVVETLDRAPLRAIQTPQAFRGDILRRAHAEVTGESTDDAGMVEQLGLPVVLVTGDPRNIKVTTPSDLVVAEALLRAREG